MTRPSDAGQGRPAMVRLGAVERTFHPGTPDAVRALAGVDLEISEGEWVVVIGTNGSGKSMLLNAIAGASAVDAGTISLAGQDVTHWPEHRRARIVGRIFQNPFSGTAPAMSIAENFALAARRGLSRGFRPAVNSAFRAELRTRVSALGMGLEDRLDTAIGTLSGGQRQALTLLMATWHDPGVLLLDEHTAALDPRSAAQVQALTADIVHGRRLAALMVTHSMPQAVTYGDRIIMMHRGRVRHDFRGEERRRLGVNDLLACFEEAQRNATDHATASPRSAARAD